MLRSVLFVGSMIACLVSTALAAAERVALVVGNSAYQNAPPLPNPVNDATAIAGSLRRLGFEVVEGKDLDLRGMREAIRDYGRLAADADLALFFYAGHGLQVAGKNYLLPIDSGLAEVTDLDFDAIDVDLVMRQVGQSTATNITILDACRDNPFETRLARSLGATRSASALGRGLAPIEASGGSLIVFATDPGDVALDGEGEHSPFTAALLDHLETPDLEVNLLMTRVRADVYRGTRGEQRPWTNSSLLREIYLGPERTPPAAADLTDGSLELALWNAAEAGGAPADYEAYLDRFPNGLFAPLARNRIAGPGGVEVERAAPAEPSQTVAAYAPTDDSAPPPATLEQETLLELGTQERREVQERLTLLGYDTRGIDGVFGRGTRDAISDWQSANGVPATGFLDRAQLDRLGEMTDQRLVDFRAARSTSVFRAVAVCPLARGQGSAEHADNRRAMLLAARDCVNKGGTPQCCAAGVRLLR